MSSAGEPKSYARNATARRRKQSALPSPLLKLKSARQQRVGQLGSGSHSSLRDGQAECLAIAAPREDAFLMADNSEEARAQEVGFDMHLSQRQHELLRLAANAPDGAIWAGKDLGGKRPLTPELEDLVRRGFMVQAGEKWSILRCSAHV
jgi:hypothetical protein